MTSHLTSPRSLSKLYWIMPYLRMLIGIIALMSLPAYASADTLQPVTLTWTENVYADSYKLVRKDGAIDSLAQYVEIPEVITGDEYTDSTTLLSKIYTYKIVACLTHPDSKARLCDSVGEYSAPLEVKPGSADKFDFSAHGGAPVSHSAINATTVSDFFGAINGQASVSGGAASYQIPIVIPPGRKGMQPAVSVSYSSRAGNGLVGVGWNLNAGSSISRCSSTMAQDGTNRAIKFDGGDKLCFEGQRLVPIDGNYGQTGTTYTTEIDSFVTVTQYGRLSDSTAYFTVALPNGNTRIYGQSNQARITPTGAYTPLTWLIEKESDLHANNIKYHYSNDYSDGEILLSYITYTGYNNNDGSRKVRFIYENAGYYSTQYLAGAKTRSTQRLQAIETFYASTKVREYNFSYTLSESSTRPLLKSVTECGYKGGASLCSEPTSFSWTDEFPLFVTELVTKNDGSDILPRGTTGKAAYLKNLHITADFDGNGVRDWHYKRSNSDTNVLTHFNAEGEVVEQKYLETYTNCYKDQWTHQSTCFEADFNIDGISDAFRILSDGTLQIGYTLNKSTITFKNAGFNVYSKGSETHWNNVTNVSDYNGDGYPDFIIKSGSSSQYSLYLYLHKGDNSGTPYNGTPIHLLTINGNATKRGAEFDTNVQFVGDMNGDGMGDFTIYGKRYFRQIPTHLSLLLTEKSGNSITLKEKDIFFSKSSDSPLIKFQDYTTLIDVNGDGLSDWVGFIDNDDTLSVKLNKGDGNFDAAQDLGISLESRTIPLTTKSNLEPEYGWEPKFSETFQQMDVNGDGRSELLMPDYIAVGACAKVREWKTASFWENATKCGAALSAPYATGQYSTATLSPEVDRNVYQFKALGFKEDAQGNVKGYFITKSDKPRFDLKATRALNVSTDAFGKGLHDIVFAYGCYDSGCSMQGGAAPAPFNNNEDRIFVSKNYGATTTTSPSKGDYQPVDLMVAANNGIGMRSEWKYRPLSSQSEGDDFYNPGRDENGFVDEHHFNFASSMYVVSRHLSSNGVGSQNTTAYQYSGAVYNTQGRGFRGFRSILEKDLASQVSTRTLFKQKFPESSHIESQTVFASTALTDWSCKTASSACPIISRTENSWSDNPHHNLPGVYLYYMTRSDAKTYDISSRELVSHKLHQVMSVDKFNNVEKANVTIKDELGEYATTTYGDYQQASRSWPSRYNSKTQVKHKVKGQAISVPAELNYDKVVKTQASWNETTRVLETQKVWHGETSGEGTQLTPQTLAATTTTTYNMYGLPTKVSTTGNVYVKNTASTQSQRRLVTTTYTNDGQNESADGYFPLRVIQENGPIDLVTQVRTDPATGLPKSETAPTGAVTITHYDALARPVKIEATGFPAQLIAYQKPDFNAPSLAVMQTVLTQAGVPETKEYKDVLGRSIRTATKHFDDVQYIFNDVIYNPRGLVAKESAPYLSGASPIFTTYSGFDALGRPTSKETPQTRGRLQTTYSYNKLNTAITVEPTVGQRLSMSRAYNSLEQLVRTVDASGGVTQYAYDGAGNPIIIKDAKNNDIQAKYDGLGRKVYVKDPNQGTTHFTYNDFGELEKELDANNQSIYYEVDALGRVVERGTSTGEVATFVWDTKQPSLLTKQSVSGHSTEYDYDEAARVISTTVRVNTPKGGETFTTYNTYDNNLGRPLSLEYPAFGNHSEGIKIEYLYNDAGYLTTERNAESHFEYRTVTAQDAFGNIAEARINNASLKGTYNYHAASGQMLSTQVGQDHNLTYVEYDSYGNLKEQRNSSYGMPNVTETFTYDALHRLTRSSVSGSGISDFATEYGYDAVGNMLKKSDYSAISNGAYEYKTGTNQLNKVRLKSGSTISFTYDSKGNQTHRNGAQEVWYNPFNKPTKITKGGSNIQLYYGADLARYKQTRVVDGKTTTTYYIGKHFEVEETGGKRNYKSYISDIAIITEYDGGGSNILFTHRDRLGSAVTMTDHLNEVRSRRFYDPFGKPRNGDWSTLTNAQIALNTLDERPDVRRGFTDHEHLDEAELIHMNGRVYDYNVGRFMSVDPLVHGGSQGINPYSYMLNNPLSGTDPTGYSPEDEVKKTVTVTKTGSRIKHKVEVSAKSNGSGGATVTFSGSNGAAVNSVKNSVSNSLSGAGYNVSDIGSQGEIAKNNSQFGTERARNQTVSNDIQDQNEAEKPKDKLSLQDQAAVNALTKANELSVKENLEYGGLIYRKKDGTYGYTEPMKGTDQGFSPSKARKLVPKGAKVLGDYHTHGDYSTYDWDTKRAIRTGDPKRDDFRSDYFSENDYKGIRHDSKGGPRYRGYLGTPSGTFRAYDPTNDKEYIIK
ncbi:DUF4329 domain-containing protein [Aestuariibacter sp. AA17]|uniref:DUF4329 domain-containing protein n=1 Tax=Fluctibacter corallii TaxID=2984329 RepID=A0ABT3A8J8_9ALTE|nr:DUF4329 domain-containing protein [Aestuariibacter sp. AA17]MCV2884641.1 DUF4329 domain-containing protein [Aestuariibacter sp. AA17]